MGALHEGHIALVKSAVNANDITVCSIFVNPVQFNNQSDLAKYPRTLDSDLEMLREAGCTVVFAPTMEEMYPEYPRTTFNFGNLETVMEGSSRPGHFSGVGIVVSKLFNIVLPDRAYFGQKDLQQVSVVRQLIADLSFGLELIIAPTVRETDGLAMSSRNRRLNSEERALAPTIYAFLQEARKLLISGNTVAQVKDSAIANFGKTPLFKLDYFEVVETSTLQPVDQIEPAGGTAICIAIFLGEVRLIDNIVF